MSLIRKAILSRQNLALKLIQWQINSKNVDATSLTRGVQFCQQRFCSSELKQQSVPENDCQKHPVGQVVTKMKLMFTCKKCSTRNDKLISKLSYEKGVVIIRCDGCKNNHLIADNLGWFSDRNEKTNIEYILRQKGETVRRIANDSEGYLEFVTKEVLMKFKKKQKLNKLEEEKSSSLDNVKHQESDQTQEEISNEKEKDVK